MQKSPVAVPRESTTGRSLPRPLRALGAALRTVSAGSAGAAAALAEQVMFRTRRLPESARARETMAQAERLRIPSDHGELAAYRWGDGPLVVLLHGWNGRASQLSPLVAPLVARGRSVVALDAPGHGDSPGSVSSLFHFADGLDAVLEATRPLLGPAEGVVAHSMGGAAATFAMHRHAAKAASGVADAPELPARRFAFVAPPIDVGDFIGGFARTFGLDNSFEVALRRRVERRFGVSLRDVYGPTLARAIRAPLLVVHDADDREVPIDRGRALAAAWPGATLLETRGLGHVRVLSDAGVAERVAEFVTGEARRASAA